ncbi:MAG: hypothetical protein JNK53_03830 [Phycisphaerae bacterium]|nr:hypothetical protein [Phycisphaerae bacterium]
MATPPPQLLKELNATLATLQAATADSAAAAGASTGPLWGAMHKLLLKAKVDPTELMRLVGARDTAALARVVARLGGEDAPEPGDLDTPHQPAGAPGAVDATTMQHALRMFRKRLKLSQLDAESKLGVGPMSSGSDKRIQAMEPPREFPLEVWEALVHAGKLRREGRGFYSIVEEPGRAHW